MTRPLLSFIAVACAATLAVFFADPALQAQNPTPVSGTVETPRNLKVLSTNNNLTLRQVRGIMDEWTDELGADCSTCHVRNPQTVALNSRARFNYADDSKEEKNTARVMYRMTEAINADYVAKVPNSGVPVSCGTCHRGHLSPEPFTSPRDAPSVRTPAVAR